MAQSSVTDAQFVTLWGQLQSPTAMADKIGINVRNVYERRKRLVAAGWDLPTREDAGNNITYKSGTGWTYPRQRDLSIENGSIIVSSDHHYWPEMVTVAHLALLEVHRLIKPKVSILNGDIFDGAKISRHPPFGFASLPSVKDELDACKARVDEIIKASPDDCQHFWNIGNHCVRFERTLAQQASDFEGLQYFRLEHHFPRHEFQWSTAVNWDSKQPVMIKHRLAGGVHAGYNNAMKGGVTIVTGHTHILEAKPFNDYNGRRWGVQTGTVSDPQGPQKEYAENAPSQACSGFVVLTWKDGRLLPPEMCEVIDGKAYFRGEVVA